MWRNSFLFARCKMIDAILSSYRKHRQSSWVAASSIIDNVAGCWWLIEWTEWRMSTRIHSVFNLFRLSPPTQTRQQPAATLAITINRVAFRPYRFRWLNSWARIIIHFIAYSIELLNKSNNFTLFVCLFASLFPYLKLQYDYSFSFRHYYCCFCCWYQMCLYTGEFNKVIQRS